jgi:hypothetical protein
MADWHVAALRLTAAAVKVGADNEISRGRVVVRRAWPEETAEPVLGFFSLSFSIFIIHSPSF